VAGRRMTIPDMTNTTAPDAAKFCEGCAKTLPVGCDREGGPPGVVRRPPKDRAGRSGPRAPGFASSPRGRRAPPGRPRAHSETHPGVRPPRERGIT
jgi:hypothetical protein